VLSYYARLADRVPEPSAELEQRRVLFEAMTPMTKAELLYGLETALSLNGLAVVAEGEKAVRLGLRR
jgi:hypothetical protein